MKVLDAIYKYTHLASYLQSPFLLLTRIYWGLGFVMAGLYKFHDIEKTRDFFASLSIPQPLFNAFFVASIEMIGGILLAVGFLSRLVSLPLIIIMCAAYATAHHEALKAIFTDISVFVKEPPFTFLFASLLILIFGPGKFSIDYLLRKER